MILKSILITIHSIAFKMSKSHKLCPWMNLHLPPSSSASANITWRLLPFDRFGRCCGYLLLPTAVWDLWFFSFFLFNRTGARWITNVRTVGRRATYGQRTDNDESTFCKSRTVNATSNVLQDDKRKIDGPACVRNSTSIRGFEVN
jgi:hypothetical protein